MDLQVRSERRRKQLAAAVVLVFGAVFLADLIVPLGYVVAPLYILAVFLAVLSGRARWVAVVSSAAFVATLAGFAFKPRLTVPLPATAYVFNRVGFALMIGAAGAIGWLVVARSLRLAVVSDELAAANAEVARKAQLVRAASHVGKIVGWSVGVTGDQTMEWSDEVAPMLGGSNGHTQEGAWLEYFDQPDRLRFEQAIRDCKAAGTPFVETCRVTTGDGRRLWVTAMGEATTNDQGTITGVSGALQDVTVWKEAEATAIVQRRLFTQLATSVPSVIWTAEPAGEIDYFNQALADYTGLTSDQLLASGWFDAVHPEEAATADEEWRRAVADGEPYWTTFRLRRADGEYRWFRVTAQPERGDDGSIVKWWGNAVDIDELRLLENEARRLAQEQTDILESIGDGVCTLDLEFRITYINTNAELLLGRPASEVLGKIAWDVFPQTQDATLEEGLSAASESRESRQFTTFNSALATWFDLNVTPTAPGLTIFFRDVTVLKSLAERLAQAQRMESVGRLTGGIAHDFNNLLTVVIGGAETLGDEPHLTEGGRVMLRLVAGAAARGGELTHQLLAFSRQQPLAPQFVDVPARFRAMWPILSRTVGPGIAEVALLQEGLPAALVDPGQFENVLLNLAINARDAMPKGGTLTISAKLTHLDEAYSTIHSEVSPGDYILVSVGDTGTGITSDDLPRIFEPFFTTKAVGDGSGLGLSMVWGFAQQTGGHVTVYSEVGLGTTFHLYLPLAHTGARAEEAVPGEVPASPPGSGHILLAEDDPLVREFAAERLRLHGYQVSVAATGVEALELLAGIETLALLFTDVIMVGGISGRDLADEVTFRRPGTPVLFASGYTEEVMMHQGRLDPGVDLLAKPYTGRQLLERVHAALAGGGRGAES